MVALVKFLTSPVFYVPGGAGGVTVESVRALVRGYFAGSLAWVPASTGAEYASTPLVYCLTPRIHERATLPGGQSSSSGAPSSQGPRGEQRAQRHRPGACWLVLRGLPQHVAAGRAVSHPADPRWLCRLRKGVRHAARHGGPQNAAREAGDRRSRGAHELHPQRPSGVVRGAPVPEAHLLLRR